MSEVQERLAGNLVTSENLAEFTAQKLGLVDTPANEAVAEESAEPVAEADQSGQDGEGKDATATDEAKEKKPNPKLERRFSEITKQREQARQEAQREREQREALEARLKELESKVNPPPVEPEAEALGPEPQPERPRAGEERRLRARSAAASPPRASPARRTPHRRGTVQPRGRRAVPSSSRRTWSPALLGW